MIKTVAMERALRIKREAVEKARARADERRDEAFQIQEIALAHERYVRALFKRGMGKPNADEEYENARLSYQNALKKYGFSENDFKYPAACPICNDTGNDGGKACACVYDAYLRELEKECDILSRAPFTFDDADFASVKDSDQAETLKKLFAFGKKFAAKIPDAKIKILTLSGSVGTGKTCLASAVAREVVRRGHAALFTSAYEFNSLCLRYHTSPIALRSGIIEDVLSAELLVIDDLGTEPMLKNVTVEYLLLTLEERTRRGLVSVITTNLDADRLMFRYGERIYSRLADKNVAQFMELKGADLRKK